MFGVLDPQGPIALQERNLIIVAVFLMLLIAIPLLIAQYAVAWRYRAGNKEAAYKPDQSHSVWWQVVLWAIPTVIVVLLSIINWQTTHALDPYKPLASGVKPITIQVVALDWKWLFIYPEQGISTVNFIEFPVNKPIKFELTADAPMNSFWIPQLGSQMYAMAGMTTQLNLMASTIGEFSGKAAEINGKGYAGMTFLAKSVSDADFSKWVRETKELGNPLTKEVYDALAKPSENHGQDFFSSVDSNLYNSILMKFMVPASSQDKDSEDIMHHSMPNVDMVPNM